MKYERIETLAKIYQNLNTLPKTRGCLDYVRSILESKNAVNNDFYDQIIIKMKQLEA